MTVRDKRLVSITAPASLEAEQYQNLRLKLVRLKAARDIRMIALSSPTSGDGKTVSAINLAGAMGRGAQLAAPEPGRAKAGVLLIEADLRRPAIARRLGLPETAAGLADLVVNETMMLNEAVQKLDAGFSVLPAGVPTIGVHEIIESPRLRQILAEAREQYDYVILDTPPFVPVSDSRLLSQLVDGVILVVSAHKTPRKLLEETLNAIDGSTVLGILFNRDDRPFFGYRRHYYRGYAPRTAA